MNKHAWLMTALVSLAACGSSGPEEFASSYCDLIKPCCAAAGLPGDGKQCRAVFTAFSGLGTFNEAAADQCLSELRQASSRGDFCAGNYDPPSCNQVLGEDRGNKKPGETCTEDEDCATSPEGETSCQRASTGGAEIRKCQVQVKGVEGSSPCVATVDGSTTISSSSFGATDVAAKGYLCYVSDGLTCRAGTCVKIEQVGGMCTSSVARECVAAAYCDTAKKMCAQRKSAGAACTGGFFNDQECAAGTYCADGTKVCTALAAKGAACTEDDACASGNCVNGKCGAEEADFGLQIICGS
jgi:hypothetical protein